VRLPIIVVTAVCLSWSTVHAEDYKFPYHDPYLATVTGAVLNADGRTPGLKRQVVHVPVLPGRNELPGLEGRGALSVALYRQSQPAPLLFIIPGTGSTPYFGLATYFARLFHKEGFHVAVLPSPMSWNFALAASRSGTPGYTPDDARDLYEAMQKTLAVFQTQYGVKVTGINFMGMSLGALEGAYLSLIDAEEGKIGIARYLLVNPPLHVSSVLRKLDEWAALQATFGRSRSEQIQSKALGIVEAFAKQGRDDPAAMAEVAKGFATFTRDELQFLIAEYLQTLLPELVYVTQAIHDQDVFTAPKDQIRKRLQEAKGTTFTEYSDKIAVPRWRLQIGQPDADTETFNSQGSLALILERLLGNPRVYIMHNADDFLADRSSIEQLKEAMGSQVTLYPYGGHLGNLWYPQNKESIRKLFKP
jgi:hypothetical protein